MLLRRMFVVRFLVLWMLLSVKITPLLPLRTRLLRLLLRLELKVLEVLLLRRMVPNNVNVCVCVSVRQRVFSLQQLLVVAHLLVRVGEHTLKRVAVSIVGSRGGSERSGGGRDEEAVD